MHSRACATGPDELTGSLPVFKFVLSGRNHLDYGYITADYAKYHLVRQFDEFFAFLGYTTEVSQSGVEVDFYVWDTFISKQAKKSPECLQTQIAAYLNQTSKKFREEFGGAYDKLISECRSDHLGNDVVCSKCPKKPETLPRVVA
jgi:hypothetical protein